MTVEGRGAAAWVAAGLGALLFKHRRLAKRHRELERLQRFTETIGGPDPVDLGLRELGRLLPVGATAIAVVVDGGVFLRRRRRGFTDSIRLQIDEQAPDQRYPVVPIAGPGSGLLGQLLGDLGGASGIAFRAGGNDRSARYIVAAARPGSDGVFSAEEISRFEAAAGVLAARIEANRSWERLESNAFTDELTGLANRLRLETVLATRFADDAPGGTLLNLTLRGFAEVNDSLGHRLGDELLRAMAARISSQVRDGDLAARLEGGEFAVILEDFPTSEELERRLAELVAHVGQPIDLDGITLDFPPAIGVVRWPTLERKAADLLPLAHAARRRAERSGLPWCHHDGGDTDAGGEGTEPESVSLVRQVRKALDGRQFHVHLQPQLRADDLSLIGAEALLRWNHPTLGLVSPGAFLPSTEYSSLAPELTRHALGATVDAAKRLAALGSGLVLSMNITNRDLIDPTLPETVARALDERGLSGAALGFEVTESSLIADIDAAIEGLLALSSLGCRTSVDDFGTGFASLRYIQCLPVDEVKIDSSFVSGSAVNAGDAAIVRSTTALMHDLGFEVVAEGVEDGPTLRLVTEIGCDIVQGYAVGRPLPLDRFESFARGHGLNG